MSASWILDLGAGAGAALLHLLLTWLRVTAGSRGWVAAAVLTMPIAIALPAIALFTAIGYLPGPAWLCVLSFWGVQTCALGRWARS